MNFLLISPPGWGKTTALCSGRHPTLLVDVDLKAQEMYNIRPLIEKGDVVVHPIKDRLVVDTLRHRAEHPDQPPSRQPEGYLNTVDFLNRIADRDPEFAKFKTIGLDGLSRVSEHLKRLLIYHRGQGKFGRKVEDDMNWPSWGSYLANLEELFTVLCSMDDKDFICTAHLKEETETQTIMVGTQVVEQSVVIGYKPLIDGQMRSKLAGYFNEVYFLDAKTSGKNPKYQFRTRGTKYDARTSLPLDEYEPADIMGALKKGGL